MKDFLRKILHLLTLLSVVAVIGFLLFRYQYNDAVRELAYTQVKNTTSDLINDAIDTQIQSGNIEYDRIVYF